MTMQIDDTLGYLICRTARKVHRHIEKIFSPYGLTLEQWVAMKILAETPDISQKELSAQMKRDANTVKAIVDRLIKKDYVRRELNPSDRRAFLLQLTKAGQLLVDKLAAADEQENRQLEEKLGEADTVSMKKMLLQIEEMIRE
ncbi:MarR family winged helix-turn-helix transcriptional regulator [Selenomonas sp. AE3005]|uniref:MarR family winged helix-turn-helix transcriptional regulator n=1 Tax=Selenomonas sp. AE3005 TaxID=1485543 RepID=UPI0009DD50E6|nr:MarR family transcriptional regulator [Selenomonas sp. AE3005]